MAKLVPGPSGEIVGYYEVVDEEPVSEDMATKTSIRWLLGKHGEVPNFAMRLFRVEPGGHIKAHKHPWEHEIFILEGVGEVRIASRIYRVSKGFFLYIPPNIEHEYWNKSNKDLLFLCMIPLQKK